MLDQKNPEPAIEGTNSGGSSQSDRGAVVFLLLLGMVILAVGFGPMVVAERRNARILREGLPAKARVTKIVPTGNYHNNQPEVAISLDVTPEAGDPFSSKVETYVSPVYLPRFQPGLAVDVRFDPKKRRDVVLVPP